MTTPPETPSLRLRVDLGPGEWIGPGKVELLERIAQTGSISAAGRAMGMSYKRAWQLVETLNRMFAQPLVESTRGGASGGGASVTQAGKAVLTAYRALEVDARKAGEKRLAQLAALQSDIPAGK